MRRFLLAGFMLLPIAARAQIQTNFTDRATNPSGVAITPGALNTAFAQAAKVGTVVATGGDASATIVTATGTTAARPLAARFADTLNVRDFGAKGDGVTDDSPAFAATINAMMARIAVGSYPCVYAPAATYLLRSTTLPTMAGAGCIVGDSELHTIFVMDPAYNGDLISFDDSWPNTAFPYNGNTPTLGGALGGPALKNFSIVGSRATTQTQNAIMFYDRNMFLNMSDIEVRYVKGRALAFGITKTLAWAFIQESRITRTRFYNDGAAGVPVVEFNAAGAAGQEGSGEIDVDTMDIYANYGPGLVIRNAAATAINEMRFSKVRVEGLENNPTGITADLLTIGDPTLTGIVDSLTFRQTSLLDPYAGFAALRTTAPSYASQPYFINFEGYIGGGAAAGKGLQIDAGRLMSFKMMDIATLGTNVTVGAVPLVGAEIQIEGTSGREEAWTWNVDPSAASVIESTPLRVGTPNNLNSLGLELAQHDGSNAGGYTIGAGAIDLQAYRSVAAQVASGSNSALVGGISNAATGSASSVIGGTGNLVSGYYSAVSGGAAASDRGRIASQAFGSGTPNGLVGGAQFARQPLYSTGTGAMRLTAGNNAAANYASVFNIYQGATYNLSIRLSAVDRTVPINSYVWTMPIAMLNRYGPPATTTLQLGTPVTLSFGTGSTATVTATADTVNGGLNLTFTPPTGTDVWDAFADVSSAEVQ